MAARKTKKASAPRRSYAGGKKKKRRVNTLNKSVKKPMQAAGVAVGGILIPYGAAMVEAVKSKSIAPASAAIMSKDNAIKAAKGAAVGFIAGTVAGTVADKAGLKRPINKMKRALKGLTGGLL